MNNIEIKEILYTTVKNMHTAWNYELLHIGDSKIAVSNFCMSIITVFRSHRICDHIEKEGMI